MPLANTPIVGRRVSDSAVSRAYGGRKCGTHTPNALRPGRLSDGLKQSYERAGYPLLTNMMAPVGLIEVYPHPALVELAGASIRLPYKASKVRSYWPVATPTERRVLLYRQWSEIVTRLEGQVAGVMAALPNLEINASGRDVKAYEDALDAIICAWVAICGLEGPAHRSATKIRRSYFQLFLKIRGVRGNGAAVGSMSALPPKVDIRQRIEHVCVVLFRSWRKGPRPSSLSLRFPRTGDPCRSSCQQSPSRRR